MGFSLQAVVGAERVLRAVAGGVATAHIAPLGQHLSLLPMTDEFFDAVTIADAPRLDGFWMLPAGFEHTLAACSVHGPVAYLEADYVGGAGEQAAQVWDSGRVVLGPLRLAVGQPVGLVGSPVSQALRRLGVARGRHRDEFDAVRLGRKRDTRDWLG